MSRAAASISVRLFISPALPRQENTKKTTNASNAKTPTAIQKHLHKQTHTALPKEKRGIISAAYRYAQKYSEQCGLLRTKSVPKELFRGKRRNFALFSYGYDTTQEVKLSRGVFKYISSNFLRKQTKNSSERRHKVSQKSTLISSFFIIFYMVNIFYLHFYQFSGENQKLCAILM